MGTFAIAAVLATTILLASMVSVELGVTVALIELTFGVVAGNVSTTVPSSRLSLRETTSTV